MLIEMADNMQVQRYSRAELLTTFVEMGWWSIRRAAFATVEGVQRRPLMLADEQEDADEEFRYYRAQFRYADTGEPLNPPLQLSLRWPPSC